jgi:hypothetical protein
MSLWDTATNEYPVIKKCLLVILSAVCTFYIMQYLHEERIEILNTIIRQKDSQITDYQKQQASPCPPQTTEKTNKYINKSPVVRAIDSPFSTFENISRDTEEPSQGSVLELERSASSTVSNVKENNTNKGKE